MTTTAARTIAVNVMRALLAIPGARREIDLDDEEGIAFLEALGKPRETFYYPAVDGKPASVLEGGAIFAAHGFAFRATIYRPMTVEEIVASPASVHTSGTFQPSLGADL